MGPCGLCRFERDVLNVEGVTHVIMALGINDIGLGYRYSNGFKDPSQAVSSKQIIDAMQKAIDKAIADCLPRRGRLQRRLANSSRGGHSRLRPSYASTRQQSGRT
jgi:hypothetical protein